MIVIISKEMNEVGLKLYCVVVDFLCKPVIRSWAFPWIWLTFDTASACVQAEHCQQFIVASNFSEAEQSHKTEKKKTVKDLMKYLKALFAWYCWNLVQNSEAKLIFLVLRVQAYRHKTFIVFSQNKKQNFEREFLYDLVIRNTCRSSN